LVEASFILCEASLLHVRFAFHLQALVRVMRAWGDHAWGDHSGDTVCTQFSIHPLNLPRHFPLFLSANIVFFSLGCRRLIFRCAGRAQAGQPFDLTQGLFLVFFSILLGLGLLSFSRLQIDSSDVPLARGLLTPLDQLEINPAASKAFDHQIPEG
jgi:hypothetical protein